MPPKNKDKKNKKDKKSKYPIIIEGVVTNDMSREELESYIVTIRRELEKERNERNFFQLERDKVNNFWEICRKQLEETKLNLLNKDCELEEMEEKHQLELKVYRQKVKHLMYEHENNEANTKTEKTVVIAKIENDFRIERNDFHEYNMNLKYQMRTKQIESEEYIKSLKKDYESQLTKLRLDFIHKSKELDQVYQEKMRTQREEMNLRRKSDIHEIEERKNMQIRTLIEHHDEAFRAMKNFYNEITLNNINIIKTLKENIESLRKKLLSTEIKLENCTLELKKKTEMVSKLDSTLIELSKTRAFLESEKMAHKIANGHISRLNKENKELNLENELISTRFDKLASERQTINEKFEKILLDIQQKTGMKNLILERKLASIREELEKKDIQLFQIVSVANLDPDAIKYLKQQVERVLNGKNKMIKDLEYEMARTIKSHTDLKATFEAYISEMGQYIDNVGFNSMKCKVPENTNIGKGPGGLVSVPS